MTSNFVSQHKGTISSAKFIASNWLDNRRVNGLLTLSFAQIVK